MHNIILSVHMILALVLIIVVLMQRSEGGGLGIGSSGGNAKAAARASMDGITKLTWYLAMAFLATSLTLTIMAANNSGTASILDSLQSDTAPAETVIPLSDIPSLPAE